MQAFITIITTNSLYHLIVYAIPSSKSKLSTIDMTLLQNDYFDKWDITGLSALLNLQLPLCYEKSTLIQVISDPR